MKNIAAVITGASGGIGQALCRAFKEAGYWIIGLDILPAAEYCDVFISANLDRYCESSDYREAIDREIKKNIGAYKLLLLINNAAVQILKPTEEITLKDWSTTLNVNLAAPFLLSQSLLPQLEAARGSIINMASIHATLTKPGFVCYATSKAALVGLTRSLAVDLGPRVRVNAICPAAVATPMLSAGFKGKEKEFAELSRMHPIGRIATPDEVAQAALFLASAQASFVTGMSFNIDGGIGTRLHDPS